jgi:hypothetical protein
MSATTRSRLIRGARGVLTWTGQGVHRCAPHRRTPHRRTPSMAALEVVVQWLCK